MPDCWATDPQRRKKAGIPGKLEFATKPELAIAQLKRLAASGLRVCWVAADEVYGRCGAFRDACRALSLSYVAIVPCRSEEHTSELQSRRDLVCRLLLEKKKKKEKSQHDYETKKVIINNN